MMKPRDQWRRVVALAVFVVFSWAARAEGAPILSLGCEPECAIVNQGDTFDLLIRIADVTDLVSFSFGLTFDPDVVRVNDPADISYGTFLQPAGSVSYSPVPCDQDPTLTCAPPLLFGGAITGLLPGVSGSGTLATIRFSAGGFGDSGLAFVFNLCDPDDTACQTFNPLFFDEAGELIDLGLDNGSVFVQSTVPVPEPATISLLSLGLLGVARRVRRQRRRGSSA
jgi:hypothetical protein